MKFLVLAAVVAFGLAACKKKDITYVVEGVVTDNSFSQPLSGATVKLYEYEAGSSAPSAVLATYTTGSDGKYRFEFKREKVEKYYISIEKDLYFSTDKTFHADDLSVEETNTFSHSTTAKAWVKLRFINTDPGTNLKYIRQNGKSGCEECCASGEQFLYGAVDETIYCINDGNYTYGYYYWILSTPDNGPMSVVTPAFDTTELILNY